jgi:hypothetical protein
MNPTTSERFNERYIPEPNSGCWLWVGAILPDKYGTIRIDGRTQKAHRVSWELHRGQIPEGLFVCHKCDVRCCVNPDHLFLGTQQDNVNDMMRKGRGKYAHAGAKNPQAKLTDADVIAIRSSRKPYQTIAEQFGIATVTVGLVRRRITWRHVP